MILITIPMCLRFHIVSTEMLSVGDGNLVVVVISLKYKLTRTFSLLINVRCVTGDLNSLDSLKVAIRKQHIIYRLRMFSRQFSSR